MVLKKCFLIIAFAALFMAGCISGDNTVVNSKGINTPDIYFDYKIGGDEESGDVTIKLQYRKKGAEGEPIGLNNIGEVTFDDEVLQSDSSRMNGSYYEASRLVKDFAGQHHIIFTDFEKKEYREEFNFSIFSLKTAIPEMLSRKDLVLELDGLDTTDFVHLLVYDTSFYSRGIDKVDTVKDGRITISQNEMDNLRNGPVFLEIYREENRP